MATLYGRTWTRADLCQRAGDLGQLAGIERVVLDDGPARGLRAALLRTGSGLEAEILLDRAMDLGRVSFKGQALGYRAPSGDVHPSRYDAQSLGWLRSFGAGLVTTCGLQNVGSPCEDEGLPHGLHGGIGNTPAHEVSTSCDWEGDEYVLRVRGKVREIPALGLFGPNLLLTRTITSRLGSGSIELEDRVENQGFTPSSLMLLYHVNVGFPVVDDGTRLLTASRKVEPRDNAAKPGLKDHDRFGPPQPGFAEQVYFHEMIPDAIGRVEAALVAPERGGERLALALEYGAGTLPRFIEWKMTGAGAYVVGLEPANCLVMGRAEERKRGTLSTLQPGECRVFSLKLSVLASEKEIQALEARLAQRRASA